MNKKLLGKILHFILLSRPYSIPSIILISILAIIVSRGSLVFDSLTIFSIVFVLLLWFSLVYLNEVNKPVNKNGRIKISFFVPILFLAIITIIGLFLNPLSLLLIFFAVIATILYKLKSLDWFGSGFVFIFRGVPEFVMFTSIFLFNSEITINAMIMGFILFLLTDARNVIGDIRDITFDKYTFVKKYGSSGGIIISILLMAIAIILTPSIFVSIPLILMMILLTVFRSNNNGYFLHQIFVITTIFYLINFIFYLLLIDLFLINFAYISMVLSLTYGFVPRKSNIGNLR